MATVAQLGLSDAVTIPDAVVSRDLGGETVILNLETGIYFDLDGVATDIWQALQATGSIREVYEKVLSAYEVDPAILGDDLIKFVNQLAAKGLVKSATPAA